MRSPFYFQPVVLCCFLLFFTLSITGANWPGEASDWNGYDRFNFEVDGRACYVVTPKTAIEGNPWVWRARFPGFHTGADLILLEQGVHIAFMDTNGMLGSPTAMKHWDAFYQAMTMTYGLAKRPALEAVSRGGLFAYRWASRNPDKVSCIYADTPVCDFKSWPLGRGEGVGHPKTWANLLEQYEFTQEEALAYDQNPIDVLGPIAQASIPLMTIVSLNDKVVPPDENTFVLAKRYRELGGSIEIIEVEEGTEKSNGHHFTPPDPERVAAFIKSNIIEPFHPTKKRPRNTLRKRWKELSENYDGLSNPFKEIDTLESHFIEAGVQGTFVLFNPNEQQHLVYNRPRALQRFLPASTFKIPNSIIALETGAVKDLEEIIPYGGGNEYFKSWEKDMTLPQAMKASNVAVFHTLAKRIGTKTYQEKLTAYGYGNANPGNTVENRFWLTGPIQISPLEQVEFIKQLTSGRFPISDSNYQLLRSMIRIEETENYSLFAKSGWAGPDDPQIGWWVGWVEKEGTNYPFALNILIKKNEDAKQREIIAKACLEELLQL